MQRSVGLRWLLCQCKAHRTSGTGLTSPRRERLGNERVQQATARVVARGQAGLELVAERHQLVHLGDDAALLGEGRKGNGKRPVAAPFDATGAVTRTLDSP